MLLKERQDTLDYNRITAVLALRFNSVLHLMKTVQQDKLNSLTSSIVYRFNRVGQASGSKLTLHVRIMEQGPLICLLLTLPPDRFPILTNKS